MRIDGKVVLITGASEGIGAASACAFGRRGARLSLTARSLEKLEAVGGAEALVTAGDLTDAEVCRRVVGRTLERYGAIDVLVNNAGVGLYTPAWRAPIPLIRQMFELNFFAALQMTQLVVPHMARQGGGMIVNVGSIAGKVAFPWLTAYCATKYALGALGDGLRMELERDGVRVLTVCPGHVKTGFSSRALEGRPPEKLPRERFAITAEECAEAIARGVERNARTVVVPAVGWILVAVARLLPRLLEARLVRLYQSTERAG